LRGEVPEYVANLEADDELPLSDAGRPYREALQGDCHLHSNWSDGGAPIEHMAVTARALGHEYMVLTDHSPRLTVAHGLNRERLQQQLDVIAVLNEALAPFRILTGMEVDILEDGSLDMDDDLLDRLDVVVGSVHSKLRMDAKTMTERMVLAIANPHVDILGHCTGRQVSLEQRARPDTPAPMADDHDPKRPRPALSSTRRWRSTAARSARTHRTSCSTWPSTGTARSPSTPTPTPPASSTGSATGATRPPGTTSIPP
jgi:hypothetical protein